MQSVVPAAWVTVAAIGAVLAAWAVWGIVHAFRHRRRRARALALSFPLLAGTAGLLLFSRRVWRYSHDGVYQWENDPLWSPLNPLPGAPPGWWGSGWSGAELVVQAILAAAACVLVWGLVGRSTGGVPRCRKCWYDLSGLGPGPATCPECGRRARATARLTRRRPRRWAILLAPLLASLTAVPFAAERFSRSPTALSLVPTTALILALPVLPISWIHGEDINGVSPSTALRLRLNAYTPPYAWEWQHRVANAWAGVWFRVTDAPGVTARVGWFVTHSPASARRAADLIARARARLARDDEPDYARVAEAAWTASVVAGRTATTPFVASWTLGPGTVARLPRDLLSEDPLRRAWAMNFAITHADRLPLDDVRTSLERWERRAPAAPLERHQTMRLRAVVAARDSSFISPVLSRVLSPDRLARHLVLPDLRAIGFHVDARAPRDRAYASPPALVGQQSLAFLARDADPSLRLASWTTIAALPAGTWPRTRAAALLPAEAASFEQATALAFADWTRSVHAAVLCPGEDRWIAATLNRIEPRSPSAAAITTFAQTVPMVPPEEFRARPWLGPMLASRFATLANDPGEGERTRSAARVVVEWLDERALGGLPPPNP